jgi:hypothetical protein
MTLEEASAITERPIKTQINGFRHIVWDTPRHSMEIRITLEADGGNLLVIGTPKPWIFGSEVRKGRPRQIWVENPSVRYLKSLQKPLDGE